MAELTPGWRKSSFSVDSGNANCVEVSGTAAAVLVRDTTDRDGGTLAFTASAWANFTAELQ
jgi:Domain of unknown function (DUF397)